MADPLTEHGTWEIDLKGEDGRVYGTAKYNYFSRNTRLRVIVNGVEYAIENAFWQRGGAQDRIGDMGAAEGLLMARDHVKGEIRMQVGRLYISTSLEQQHWYSSLVLVIEPSKPTHIEQALVWQTMDKLANIITDKL